ncbi:MAG: redoxin domain-containing protein [bacterium]
MIRPPRLSPPRRRVAFSHPILGVALWAGAVLAGPTAAGPPGTAATSAPSAETPGSIEAADFRLEDYRGKYVYLDFWASWCEPCQRSFPWLAHLEHLYGKSGLAVIAVNVDHDRKAAGKFLDRHPAAFPVVWDPKGEIAKAWNVEAMPSGFLISPEGEKLAEHRGFRDGDASAIEAEVAAALANQDREDSPGAGS